MYTIFYGWRRKAGIVTLLMACVLMGVWVRSSLTTDSIEVPIFGRSHLLLVKHNAVTWIAWNRIPNSDGWNWAVSETPVSRSRVISLSEIVEPWFSEARDAGLEPCCWAIRSWLLALPPTLLSAYLILWNPRKHE